MLDQGHAHQRLTRVSGALSQGVRVSLQPPDDAGPDAFRTAFAFRRASRLTPVPRFRKSSSLSRSPFGSFSCSLTKRVTSPCLRAYSSVFVLSTGLGLPGVRDFLVGYPQRRLSQRPNQHKMSTPDASLFDGEAPGAVTTAKAIESMNHSSPEPESRQSPPLIGGPTWPSTPLPMTC